jgi:hypothetical protein
MTAASLDQDQAFTLVGITGEGCGSDSRARDRSKTRE